MTLTAFGPGKVILLGEHAVVYGHPAVAGPLSSGVTAHGLPARKCELEIPAAVRGPARKTLLAAFERAAAAAGRPGIRVRVESDLPVSMGLGSSAAFSVACAKLLLSAAQRPCAPAQVVKVALEMEQEFHGTPSGVDHTCSARGQLIHYRKKPGTSAGQVRSLKSPRPLKVLVAIAGERRPTRETVAALRARMARWPRRYDRLLSEIGAVADEGAKAVTTGDLEQLGDAMNVNQGLLCALQLSSTRIDALVHRLRELGALGAKLTGAGGNGGAVIGLFFEPEPAMAQLNREGVRCFSSQLGGPPSL